MGGDDTLTTSAEQTYVANAEQERGSVENAQNVVKNEIKPSFEICRIYRMLFMVMM